MPKREASRSIGRTIFIENNKYTHIRELKEACMPVSPTTNRALRKASLGKNGVRTHNAVRGQWLVNEVAKSIAAFGLLRTFHDEFPKGSSI